MKSRKVGVFFLFSNWSLCKVENGYIVTFPLFHCLSLNSKGPSDNGKEVISNCFKIRPKTKHTNGTEARIQSLYTLDRLNNIPN